MVSDFRMHFAQLRFLESQAISAVLGPAILTTCPKVPVSLLPRMKKCLKNFLLCRSRLSGMMPFISLQNDLLLITSATFPRERSG